MKKNEGEKMEKVEGVSPRQARKERRRENFRRKQGATSIYFLLWAIFTALSLMIVLSSALTQRFVFVHSYKEQASRELAETGRSIERVLHEDLPDWAGGNYNGYIRILSREYGVDIYVLGKDGKVILPTEPNIDSSAPEMELQTDFSEDMKIILENLASEGMGYTVYERKGGYEYAYASPVVLFKGMETYLYIRQSLDLLEPALASMNVRVVLISIFVFVLSFAVTSAVAGWFTTPISDMTKKARKLAQGKFDVDFQGSNYGKEMVELANALNFARDELSKTDKMQKDLIANVSHDFKTPLTMIKAYASMIIEISGENPEKRNKHAQVIVDEADRLANLVNDVLDLSKISSGVELLKPERMDMSACVHETLDRFAYLTEMQGYRFIVDVDEGLYTNADEVKMEQVLYNLIGNAVNYTGEDKRVFVRLKKETETTFRFSVTDTGKGIKQEEIPEIWGRYYRSSETHKRPVKGTGLGLSIVKTILERHNFLFGVESAVDEGSTFYVIFPNA
ncbi:MAG: ATP-binding protein [Clostridia bacterium]|nr:ATP-binding protein [Clostridia bacterium]